MRKYLAALAGSVLLAACNPMSQMDAAEDEIERFHNLYSAQNYDAIYASTSQELREVASGDQWNAMLTHVHERLGAVEEFSQTGFNINTNNGVTTTSITIETTFEKGEGTEFFTFYDEGEGMVLDGWEVESDELRGSGSPANEQGETVAEKPVA